METHKPSLQGMALRKIFTTQVLAPQQVKKEPAFI